MPLVKWMPRIFGIWSTTMTSPMPALKPTSTGSEIKFATIPRRSRDATKSAAPTSSVSVAEAVSRAAGLPSGTTCPNWAAVRIAKVVVVLTLSTREVPSTAYITIGTRAV